ncbi:hypothetical protein BKA70DRAFT_1329013, partial [Coprinopsis sp. MPI-PUGE-AT-0042]
MTHTQLNVRQLQSDLCTTVGVYSSGPIWGRIVDSRGPRILLACGFCFLLGGYLGMKHIFDAGLSEGQTSISIWAGERRILQRGQLDCQKLPDHMRATTAGFTRPLLLLLAMGTALPMVMGFFLLDISHDETEREDEGITGARSPLLDGEREERGEVAQLRSGYSSEDDRTDEDVELSPPRRSRHRHNRTLSRGTALVMEAPPNVYGLKLWKTLDFTSCFLVLSGTGLMYINNAGSMAQALYAFENTDYDPVQAAKWQATQVSTVSVMNCLGRIIIGIISDFTKNRYELPRSYCLVLVAFVCFSANDLWMASTVLGLGYGAAFSLFPTVCMEWFGLAHFSENWGYLSMSPMVAGNLFSLVFGYNLDRNEDKPSSAPAGGELSKLATRTLRSIFRRFPTGAPVDVRCSRGRDCYVDSLYLAMGATLVAVGLTIWASLRDRKKVEHAMKRRSQLR